MSSMTAGPATSWARARSAGRTTLRSPPRADEAVIEKRHSSAFHDTDLHARLAEAGVDRLVIAGMQTEYCIDSACRAAAALGYKVILAADAHTTFDTSVLPAERIVAHHNMTLDGTFVELMPAAEIGF